MLIEAPSMRGDATILADGGAPMGDSTRLSGGGGGGRIAVHVSSTKVRADLTLSASGGTASGTACAGGAGTGFVNSSTRQKWLCYVTSQANKPGEATKDAPQLDFS